MRDHLISSEKGAGLDLGERTHAVLPFDLREREPHSDRLTAMGAICHEGETAARDAGPEKRR